jgi:hypothetical protein
VAARAHLSPYHFSRLFRSHFEETPHEFLTRLRIGRTKTLLARGSHNVTEACFEVGFTSLGSFSSLFLRRVGLTPSEYRRHARSGVLVPRDVRPLFVPSCFALMVYGPKSARSEKRAAVSGVIFAPEQRTEENLDPAPEPLDDLRY